MLILKEKSSSSVFLPGYRKKENYITEGLELRGPDYEGRCLQLKIVHRTRVDGLENEFNTNNIRRDNRCHLM